ncbi:MAG: cellulase family glycosylhydrolase, partial [Rhizomicrobium sp.]
MQKLDMKGRWFVDESGRRVILRGVNLGGDCKVPWPDGGTEHPSDFSDHRIVSFIGRPFPLAEADEHLARLKHWGFNCLRLLTTWEAVEHAGPGQYDEAYLDYFAEVSRRAGKFGLYVFIDFHQDVWSRMSGGDGAPGWTFEAVGLDFTKFHAAGAAHVMQHKYDYAKGGRQEDRYPQMSWSSNYRLPANAIMWTLFFAGRDMTPDFKIDG